MPIVDEAGMVVNLYETVDVIVRFILLFLLWLDEGLTLLLYYALDGRRWFD